MLSTGRVTDELAKIGRICHALVQEFSWKMHGESEKTTKVLLQYLYLAHCLSRVEFDERACVKSFGTSDLVQDMDWWQTLEDIQ
jgi:hypothetical protein